MYASLHPSSGSVIAALHDAAAPNSRVVWTRDSQPHIASTEPNVVVQVSQLEDSALVMAGNGSGAYSCQEVDLFGGLPDVKLNSWEKPEPFVGRLRINLLELLARRQGSQDPQVRARFAQAQREPQHAASLYAEAVR
jgi:hypothetical protein